MPEDVRQDEGGVGAKNIGGVLAGALGKLAATGAGKTTNLLTLILSESNNVLLFTALLLLPGSGEAGWQQSTGRRGSGGYQLGHKWS